MLKVISLNINGIRAGAKKGFFDWLKKEQPDVICFQETKAHASQLTDEIFHPEGYHCEYVDAEKKGYSGVAIYSKQAPKKIITELGFDISDKEGRYIQYDFANTSIASLYLPSGSSGEERQAIKYKFLDFYEKQLQKQLKQLKQKREFIICGDWNIAHKKIDIKNWRGNQKNSGFLPEERAWLDKVFGPIGYVDAFRQVEPGADQYTWWSNRGQAYAKNVGWRLDYQVVTPGLKDKIKSATVYKTEKFSDHAPLIINYDWVL